MSRPPHRKRRARLLAGSGVTVVVVGVAFVSARSALASGGSTGTYRTAVVTRAPVVESLQRTGTIEPISQAAVAFPVAGKVATVSVHTGQAVATGDALASLDTTSLQSQLAQKKAALAQTQLTLDQAVTAANTAAAAAPTTTTTTPPTTAPRNAPSGSADAVSKVTQTQQEVDAAMARAKDSMQFAMSSCTATNGQSVNTDQCSAAEQAALSDQETVAAAQKDLAGAETALAKALQTSNASGAGATGAGSTPRTATPAASPGASAASSASRTPVITPEQLVADQAAVDAAQADVHVVEQNLAQATIVSPIAGTVAAVNLTPGATVSAGSSTANVVVLGPGGFEVATTVDVNDMPKLKVGDPATVAPDGGAASVAGQVVAVGVLPATSGTTTTYPVIVGLNDQAAALHAGASAAVSIDVSSAQTAATVPTSAVRSAGNLHFVSVLTNGKPVNTPVQVGSVGTEHTEIVSGLDIGQVVVVADLSQPLPSSNTAARTGAGGFGGGGFGGGGFGGGGGGAVRIGRGG